MTPTDRFAVVADGWFDGERLHGAGPFTFRIEEGRIADIAAGDFGATLATQGMEVVRGGFLMPGLVDAHVHLFLDGAPTDGAQRAAHLKKPVEDLVDAARASARQALACGVTLVRDAGDRHGINHRLRDEAAHSPGLAQVRSAGLGVKRPKRYGAFMARDVADDDAIRASVCELARDSDEIKLILTGIIDFDAGAVTDEPQFDLAAARLVVDTARACGRDTMVHCSGAAGLEIAARAGVGSIEHGFFMRRDLLALMAERDVAWTPTFCPVHFQWAQPAAVGWSAQTVGNLRRILDEHARHLLIARELGVRLLLGTDAGSMGVEHGHAVHEEIERYLEAGLTTAEVLQAATANARRHFGHPHPRLERGAPFDALLLERSPFADIGALRTPLHAWAGQPACEGEALQ
ncbi:amidohydrolase family protein [Thauera aromatica]|uniref:amidohydrolase family protein n=1 Tax=Thauera aromatica TaxID=59405 RepID=UPI001FFCC731|nr:amidohydrolase family protein [Thauera aromatica]MCK2088686.1 amidohydrolase family protein [Thauera aromatica]